ncbi:MAG: hypothetical protein KF855_17270 [Acidobacteria bacterium]|nr:hypothetical protein [Acidobacteriota bacterium]
MVSNQYKLLLSPLFLAGLFLLILNDLVLKAQFGNFITGKLSDFAGLFIFPFFIAVFLPSYRRSIYIFTALLFVFWKSPFSQPLIDLVNSLQLLRFGRTIDYSDLMALVMLPASFKYFEHIDKQGSINLNGLKQTAAVFVIFVSVFAFTATSYEESRNVRIDKTYSFETSKDEFEQRIRSLKTVKNIQIKKQEDTLPQETNPNLQHNSAAYDFRFYINEPYCESQDIGLSGVLIEDQGKITLDYLSFSYWCKDAPSNESQTSLQKIFEKQVIDQL